MDKKELLKKVFRYEDFEMNEPKEERASFSVTLRDTERLLENMLEKDPIVYDFFTDCWKRVTEDFSDEIKLPENSGETALERLVPTSSESLNYMILSDLELVMEEAVYSLGEKLLDLFDAEDWLDAIRFWAEDEEKEIDETRYARSVMRDFVTFFSGGLLENEMDEILKRLYDRFIRELEEK